MGKVVNGNKVISCGGICSAFGCVILIIHLAFVVALVITEARKHGEHRKRLEEVLLLIEKQKNEKQKNNE
jgi:hypothetical protein